MSKDFSTEKERLEKLVIDSQKSLMLLERKIQAGDNRRQLIEQYTNLEHLDRETVETLIDYILVGKKKTCNKKMYLLKYIGISKVLTSGSMPDVRTSIFKTLNVALM